MRKNIGKITIDITDEPTFKKYTRIKPLYKYEIIHDLIQNEFFYLDQTDIFDFYRYDVRLRRNIMVYIVMFEEYLRALIGNQYLNAEISLDNVSSFVASNGIIDKKKLKIVITNILKRYNIKTCVQFSRFLEMTSLGELIDIMQNIRLNNTKMFYLPDNVNMDTLKEVKDLRNYVFHQRFLWDCFDNITDNIVRSLRNFGDCLPKDYRNNFIKEINKSVDGLRVSSKYTIDLKGEIVENNNPAYLYKYYSNKDYNFDALENGYIYFTKAKDFNDPNDSVISINFMDSSSYLFDLFVEKYIEEMEKQEIPEKIVESTKTSMMNEENRREAMQLFKNNETNKIRDILMDEAKRRTIIIDEKTSKIFDDIGNAFDKSQNSLDEHEDEIKESLDKVFDYLRENDFYIGCFTTNYNSILMWTHYSNSHKGFQVKVKISNKFSSDIQKVNYTYKKPLRTIEELYKSTEENVIENYRREFYTKAKEWQYEDEYRLISNNIADNKFRDAEIVEITMGYNMSKDDKYRLAKYCKEHNISLKKTVVRAQSYGVEYEDVNTDDILNAD